MTSLRLRWAVVQLDLSPAEDRETGGAKPALVVSAEPFHASNLLTVVPIKPGRFDRGWTPTDVILPPLEPALPEGGLALCSHVRTVTIGRLRTGGGHGVLADSNLRWQVRSAVAQHLGLDMLPPDDGAAGMEYYR